MPTVVIVGDADQLSPVDAAREMAASIPQSHLVIVREAGHLAPLEQPLQVNAALAEWMAKQA